MDQPQPMSDSRLADLDAKLSQGWEFNWGPKDSDWLEDCTEEIAALRERLRLAEAKG